MRISDWSSDVCSSDLLLVHYGNHVKAPLGQMVNLLVYRHPLIAAGEIAQADQLLGDRKSGVEGKSVSVRVDPGGRRILKKKTKHSEGDKTHKEYNTKINKTTQIQKQSIVKKHK